MSEYNQEFWEKMAKRKNELSGHSEYAREFGDSPDYQKAVQARRNKHGHPHSEDPLHKKD